MRTDSILNTGMSSATLNKAERVKKAREARAEQKKQVRNVILPAIEPVLEELDKERNKTIIDLMETIDASTSDVDVKSIILSLNLYKESLENLKSRLSNIMRVRE